MLTCLRSTRPIAIVHMAGRRCRWLALYLKARNLRVLAPFERRHLEEGLGSACPPPHLPVSARAVAAPASRSRRHGARHVTAPRATARPPRPAPQGDARALEVHPRPPGGVEQRRTHVHRAKIPTSPSQHLQGIAASARKLQVAATAACRMRKRHPFSLSAQHIPKKCWLFRADLECTSCSVSWPGQKGRLAKCHA